MLSGHRPSRLLSLLSLLSLLRQLRPAPACPFVLDCDSARRSPHRV